MFSRWMRPCEARQTGPYGWAVLVLLAAGSIWYLALHPAGILIGGGLVSVIGLGTHLLNLQLARRARARSGEDIGSFARAFDRRAPTFDPWVIRAVWDALAPWTIVRDDTRFPLRPADIIADLGCVGTDLDDVCLEAATRARRLLDEGKENPDSGRVETVGDLVEFISRQPRVAAA
jgi:hypothetical protein